MQRPRNAYHYPHPEWSWDDALPNHTAMAHAMSGGEEERGEVVANLWVPDVEKPHGWREVWVRRDVEPAKERRAGFR